MFHHVLLKVISFAPQNRAAGRERRPGNRGPSAETTNATVSAMTITRRQGVDLVFNPADLSSASPLD